MAGAVNPVRAARFLRFAFAVGFGMVAFRTVADSPVPQAPLELTAANLASVVDPLMVEWTKKAQRPGRSGGRGEARCGGLR